MQSPQPPQSNNPTFTQPHPTQFAAELPSQWQGGGAVSGPVNTQFRHELPGQQQRQSVYHAPPTWQRFAIMTDSDSLTSGFPYHHRLQHFGILPDQWHQFSNQVVNAAKLTRSEDYAAWGTGIASGAVASPFLLVFGPVVGYYAGKSVHKKTVTKKVKEKLAQDGDLRLVLHQWNDGIFKERGIQAWLQPPTETGEVVVDTTPGMNQRDIAKVAKKQAKRFTIIIMPYDSRNMTSNQWSTQASPIPPQASVQDPRVQNTPSGLPGAYPAKYCPTGELKTQPVIPPGVLPVSSLGQPQELSASSSELPTAFELDAAQAPQAR